MITKSKGNAQFDFCCLNIYSYISYFDTYDTRYSRTTFFLRLRLCSLFLQNSLLSKPFSLFFSFLFAHQFLFSDFFSFPRTSPILFRLERIGKCFYLRLCLVSFCILYFPFFCVSLLRISPRSFVYFVSCILPATGCIQLYASIFPILCLCICLPSLRSNVFFVFIRTRLLHIFFFIISILFAVRLNGVNSLILRVKKYRRIMTNDISKIFQFLRFLSVSRKFARSKCAKYEKIYKMCKV